MALFPVATPASAPYPVANDPGAVVTEERTAITLKGLAVLALLGGAGWWLYRYTKNEEARERAEERESIVAMEALAAASSPTPTRDEPVVVVVAPPSTLPCGCATRHSGAA